MRIVFGVAVLVGEALVVAAWATSGVASIVVMVQLLVLALLTVMVLGLQINRLRAQRLEQLSVQSAAQERGRIAEEMHDALGHELGLIAVRAGALQLTHPAVAEQTAEIREGAERATLALREIIAVWPAGSAAPTEPIDTDLSAVLARSAAAGIMENTDISGLDAVPRLVNDTVTRIVRESLTNASRYGSGPAGVTVHRDGEVVVVEVRNPVDAPVHRGRDLPGTGLGQLRRRVTLVGGTFDAGRSAAEFLVRATLPVRPMTVVTPSPGRPAAGLRRRWMISVLGPMFLIVSGVVGYYVWAVHDATADQGTIERIRPGMTQTAALSILPARDAPVRFSSSRTPDGTEFCRYVTNGNFPLGYASWRVCFGGGAVLVIDDIR